MMFFKFSVKESNTMYARKCVHECVCGILHGQRTVIFLMYNELMTVIFLINY